MGTGGSGRSCLLLLKDDRDRFPRPGDHDRTADRVAVLTNDPDRPWLLVLEFQSRHDPDKLEVTLVEAAPLRQAARHGEGRRGKDRVIHDLRVGGALTGLEEEPEGVGHDRVRGRQRVDAAGGR